MNIAQPILDAVEILTDKKIAEAKFDRTIQATISECVDASIGKYKIKFQNAVFLAYASDVDTKYTNGTSVYVLIPGNDTGENKQILGTVKKLGTNYVSIDNMEDIYDIYGSNTLTPKDDGIIGIISGDGQTSISYLTDSYDFDNDTLKTYLSKTGYLYCSFKVKAKVPYKNHVGNYGLRIKVNYVNKGYVFYELNVNDFSGNPYTYPLETLQSKIFEINVQDDEIANIEALIFDEGFNELDKENAPVDIWISDINISAASKMTEEQMQGMSIKLTTIKGLRLSDTVAEIPVSANLRIGTKLVNQNEQKVDYYWFKENPLVTDIKDKNYCQIGGLGWTCLNEPYKIKAAEADSEALVGWNPASSEKIFTSDILKVQEGKFKCVAVYEGSNISKEFTLYNDNANYVLSIASSNGNKLSGNGIFQSTILTPLSDPALEGMTYNWSRRNIDASVENLGAAATKEVSYNSFINNITYICSYSIDNEFLGTAEYTLYNEAQSEATFTLVIENGNAVYKYDEDGISPAYTGSLANKDIIPISIKALEAHIYKQNGEELTDAEYNTDVQFSWEVPSNEDGEIGSLINVTSENLNTRQLEYTIADRYSPDKTNNTITLRATYDSCEIAVKTNLSFVKEGEPGTNGTDYFCQVVDNQGNALDYIVMDWSNDIVPEFNLNAKLWNGIDTIENTTSVSWNLLGQENIDVSNEKYNSLYKLNGTSLLGRDDIDITLAYENLLQAVITFEGKKYSTVIPIITKKNCNFNLEPHTGARFVSYSSAGSSPKYSKNPFRFDGEFDTNNWNSYGTMIHRSGDNHDLTIEGNGISFRPVSVYDFSYNNAIYYSNGDSYYHIPIYFMMNRYGFQNLNEWNGADVEVKTEDGYILSPQVGAGKKENDNSFTGIMMGQVKTNDGSVNKTGLLAYGSGVQTFFLDANNGKAQFGASQKGQIILDPSNNEAIIKSGNYSTSNKTGMQINLTTPEIRFGSGKFIVDSDGKLTATDVTIKDGELNINNNFIVDTDGKVTIKKGSLTIGSYFSVSETGVIKASSGEIAGFTIDGTGMYTTNLGLWKYGHHSADNSYILMHAGAGNSNISGAPFRVYASGKVVATQANITGNITCNTITATSSGNIGGWTINGNTLQSVGSSGQGCYLSGDLTNGGTVKWTTTSVYSGKEGFFAIGGGYRNPRASNLHVRNTVSFYKNLTADALDENSNRGRVGVIDGETQTQALGFLAKPEHGIWMGQEDGNGNPLEYNRISLSAEGHNITLRAQGKIFLRPQSSIAATGDDTESLTSTAEARDGLYISGWHTTGGAGNSKYYKGVSGTIDLSNTGVTKKYICFVNGICVGCSSSSGYNIRDNYTI